MIRREYDESTKRITPRWEKRFDRLEVKHTGKKEVFGVKTLSFVDFDDQQYQLISDEHNEGVASGTPWQKGPVPLQYAITGLGPIHIRIQQFDDFKDVLEKVLMFKEIAQDGSLNVVLPLARQGYGTVHHAALRVKDRAALESWIKRMEGFGFSTSGYVDRHFFESLYARVAPQILFEFATDGPGFMGDEPYETLGEKLSLPPFLEPKRAEIEKLVRPIDTVRSTKEFIKE